MPVALTKNQRYDRLTNRIIQRHLHRQSNCVDVGAHRGEIFDLFLKYAPGGQHFGFEPLPHLFKELKLRYSNKHNCHIYPYALAAESGPSSFNYVVSNPAYSGLVRRRYDRRGERDTTIEVERATLDSVLPPDLPVQLIKIDVEGGELGVLEGAQRTMSQFRPLVIFECGVGGTDLYGTTPELIFDLLHQYGYRISLLDQFLKGGEALDRNSFNSQFYERKNYYFIAHAQ